MKLVTRRIRQVVLLAASFGLSSAVACGLDPQTTDGDVCDADKDCSSELCTTSSLCSHSACDCPSGDCVEGGEVTSDCLDGWVCVGYDSLTDFVTDPIVEYFGGKPNKHNGYCQPTCEAGCPEHYLCDDGGEFCVPDSLWAHPVPSVVWSGGASGELSGRDATMTVLVEAGSTITLSGSGSSPRGAPIVGYSWTTVSAEADYLDLEGQTIETTVPAMGYYRRVDLTVADDRSRTGMLSVTFEACQGPGATCGYQGSGCCSGSCDDASNTCV